MKEVGIGLAGLGTVGQGVIEILRNNAALLARRTGCELRLRRVVSRTPKPQVDILGAEFSTNLEDLLHDDEISIVLELMGGETVAKSFISDALQANKSVVTANKAVIALHGNELFSCNDGVALKFEAAVAGAIPIIQAVQQGLVANKFDHVMGIINGTCNYILTAMQENGATFADALATAQELGYAETDPTFDVQGIDAGHKLAILLGLAFDHPFDFSALHIEGIDTITAEDILYAAELGYKIKHLGIARQTSCGLEARVHPTLIPQNNLLANVDGVLNAVLVKSDAAGDTLFSGPGAGGSATASAVLADVFALAMGNSVSSPHVGRDHEQVEILPIAQVRCAHYIRIPTKDEPGVFARVADALSRHAINIEAAIQKEPTTDVASIVILTQQTLEADIVAALAEVESLTQVAGQVARIRVEPLH